MIGFALKTAYNGLDVSSFREGDEDYDITVQLPEENRRVTDVSFDFRHLAISWVSESSQWWRFMAIVVFFGLMVATFLTLIIVPTLYSLFSSVGEKVGMQYSGSMMSTGGPTDGWQAKKLPGGNKHNLISFNIGPKFCSF
jgi:Cu/Ag efflux pump CusA